MSLPSLAEESVAELVASQGAALPERLAAARTTRLIESALRRWGCDAAVAARLSTTTSFAAHYLLTQIAATLMPPESLDPVDLSTIALAAVSLDYVTTDEDARALFLDVTHAVDLRCQSAAC